MIPWTILAISIGLFASMGAFLMALWRLRSATSLFEPLASGLRWIAIATMFLYVCLIGAGSFAYFEAKQTESALCTLRGDLEHRVATSKTYVKDHPDKLKEFGFAPAQVKHEIANQERTIGTLDNLSC